MHQLTMFFVYIKSINRNAIKRGFALNPDFLGTVPHFYRKNAKSCELNHKMQPFPLGTLELKTPHVQPTTVLTQS